MSVSTHQHGRPGPGLSTQEEVAAFCVDKADAPQQAPTVRVLNAGDALAQPFHNAKRAASSAALREYVAAVRRIAREVPVTVHDKGGGNVDLRGMTATFFKGVAVGQNWQLNRPRSETLGLDISKHLETLAQCGDATAALPQFISGLTHGLGGKDAQCETITSLIESLIYSDVLGDKDRQACFHAIALACSVDDDSNSEIDTKYGTHPTVPQIISAHYLLDYHENQVHISNRTGTGGRRDEDLRGEWLVASEPDRNRWLNGDGEPTVEIPEASQPNKAFGIAWRNGSQGAYLKQLWSPLATRQRGQGQQAVALMMLGDRTNRLSVAPVSHWTPRPDEGSTPTDSSLLSHLGEITVAHTEPHDGTIEVDLLSAQLTQTENEQRPLDGVRDFMADLPNLYSAHVPDLVAYTKRLDALFSDENVQFAPLSDLPNHPPNLRTTEGLQTLKDIFLRWDSTVERINFLLRSQDDTRLPRDNFQEIGDGLFALKQIADFCDSLITSQPEQAFELGSARLEALKITEVSLQELLDFWAGGLIQSLPAETYLALLVKRFAKNSLLINTYDGQTLTRPESSVQSTDRWFEAEIDRRIQKNNSTDTEVALKNLKSQFLAEAESFRTGGVSLDVEEFIHAEGVTGFIRTGVESVDFLLRLVDHNSLANVPPLPGLDLAPLQKKPTAHTPAKQISSRL